MEIGQLIASIRLFSVRFLLITVLPTTALVVMFLLLVLAGALHHSPDFSHAVGRLEHLDGASIALLVGTAIVIGVVVHPMQFSFIQLLEGYWGPSWIAVRASILAARRYDRRLDSWNEARKLKKLPASESEQIEQIRARNAYEYAQSSLPAQQRLMPTRLGNILRHAEDTAGQRYGLDTVLVIPRLMPYLPASVSESLADSRLQLDVSVRFCLVWLAASTGSLAILARFPAWLFVPAVFYLLAWLSYRSACGAADGYGLMLKVAIDLHRFDLLEALHVPLPPTYPDELRQNRALMRILAGWYLDRRPSSSMTFAYQHSKTHVSSPHGTTSARESPTSRAAGTHVAGKRVRRVGH